MGISLKISGCWFIDVEIRKFCETLSLTFIEIIEVLLVVVTTKRPINQSVQIVYTQIDIELVVNRHSLKQEIEVEFNPYQNTDHQNLLKVIQINFESFDDKDTLTNILYDWTITMAII